MTPSFSTGMAGAMLAAAVLAACAGSPPTRYHALDTVPPAVRADAVTPAYDGPPLQIASVRVPPAMDRQELLREVAEGEFEIREFDHWAAPLPRMARETLSEDLAARLPAGQVAVPGSTWPQAGASVAVDILSFGIDQGVATMELVWSVRWSAVGAASGAASAAAPARPPRGGRLHLQIPAGADAGATARAWSRLLAQTAENIARGLAP